MPELDGKSKIIPTPYDTHEQVVRGPHEHVAGEGYKATDAVASISGDDPGVAKNEYPKVVAHDEKGEPILVSNTEEEAAYAAAHKEE